MFVKAVPKSDKTSAVLFNAAIVIAKNNKQLNDVSTSIFNTLYTVNPHTEHSVIQKLLILQTFSFFIKKTKKSSLLN